MAARLGSFRHNFEQKSKHRLLSINYGDLISSYDGGVEPSAGRWRRLAGWIAARWRQFKEWVVAVWEFGLVDPRNFVFAAKVGLALAVVSLLTFTKERHLLRYSVWAILTVIVVLEFSVGATLSRGFNRALGTLSAGGLALAVAELSRHADPFDELVIVFSIFITGFLMTFVRLYPTMKAYEYGLRIFLVTFCFVIVSGYRTKQFVEAAVSRFIAIALGAAVGVGVNICICPFWAGKDLHNLVVKNFTYVAKSLEGCVNGYLQCVEYERVPSKILTYQVSDDPVYSGYRSAVESKSQEDALLGFAICEPPHGPYKMLKYPWKSYVKLSGALRHCAFTVMVMHGCILSEIQAPPEMREVFSSELQRVGTAGAKVLRVLGNRVKEMTKLGPVDILIEVHEAAEELQKKIDRRSYLLVNSESWEIGSRAEVATDTSNDPIFKERARRLGAKSHSETWLDLQSFHVPRSWDDRKSANTGVGSLPVPVGSPSTTPGKQIPGLTQQPFKLDKAPIHEESKTYESASALSLATFSSLLIEFVARLQNVVDTFEELSEKAKFKEPAVELVVESAGLWSRLTNFFRLKQSRKLMVAEVH